MERVAKRFSVGIALLLICLGMVSLAFGQVQQAWVARYSGPGSSTDQAAAMAKDGAGNVYVTGLSIGSGTGNDYATVKYDASGNQVWAARYNGPGNGADNATALALDGAGNVVVTGQSIGSVTSDYATVKYNASGNQVWVARYNGPGNNVDAAYALALDGAGNVVVTGQSIGSGTGDDYATVKYDASGNQVWVARYNGPGNSLDAAYALALDNAGNVVVTGQSPGSLATSTDYATVKYDATGNQVWVARYNGTGSSVDAATALALDSAGNVVVTGQSIGSVTNFDYATLKYDASGNQVWVARYNGPGNAADIGRALALDGAGNVVVTGHSWGGAGNNYDYATLKYDTSGNQVWVVRYNGPASSTDNAAAFALDGAGNVVVTGQSWGSGNNYDYATVKYSSGNQSPALTVPGAQTVNEGVALSFNVSATDPDAGQAVTITATGLPSGATFNGTTFSWTPSFTQSGSYTVNFTATDNGSPTLSDGPKSVTVTVNDVNQPTTTTLSSPASQPWGSQVLTASVSSAGGTLTGNVTFSNGGTVLGIAPLSNGVATLAVTIANPGTYTITAAFGTSNGFLGSSGNQSLTVTTHPVALTATGTGGVVGSANSVSYTATLIDVVTGTDVVGESVNFSSSDPAALPAAVATTGPSGVATTSVTPAAVGTYTVTASFAGSVLYNAVTSAASASFAVAKAPATLALSGLSATYDGSTKAATVTTTPAGLSGVSVTYNGNSTAPAEAGSYAVVASLSNSNYQAEDATGILVIAQAAQTITFAPLADKTYGDTPFELNATASSDLPVLFAIQSGPATISGNTVTITGAGTVTVTATQAGNGSYEVAPVVSQSFAVAEAPAPLPNQLPVADAGIDQTDVRAVEGTGPLTTVALDGSGSNDPDHGPSPLAYTWTGPFGTTTGVKPTLSLPLGSHTITLTVSDGEHSTTDQVRVDLVDTRVPAIAIVGDNPAAVVGGQTYTDEGATATDVCDVEVVVTVASTVDVNVSGVYTVTYRARDDSGNESTATRTVKVTPKLAEIADQSMNEGETLDVAISSTGSGNGTLALSVSDIGFATLQDNGDGTGVLELAPGLSAAGVYGVTVTVTNTTGGNLTDSETFDLTVNRVNRPPVLAVTGGEKSTYLAYVGKRLTIQLTATDPDNESPVLTTANLPAFGALVDHGAGSVSLTFTPVSANLGEYDHIAVRASDGELTDEFTFKLVVRKLVPEIVLGLDTYSTDGGLIEVRKNLSAGYDHRDWARVPWSNYNSGNGETHVAVGDLDGDGLDEFVVGLGAGGQGRLYVFDDAAAGYSSLGWITIPHAAYNSAKGETWPAVGDVDGDGRDEVVVGLGEGGGGKLAVFDDLNTGFAFSRWIDVGGYNNRPALGDLDGDGKDEIAVGYGYKGAEGRVLVLDDASTGYVFRKWLAVPWEDYTTKAWYTNYAYYNSYYWVHEYYGSYGGQDYYMDYWKYWCSSFSSSYAENRLYNGETRPAVGDVDGDGRAEIVVGLGRGGNGYAVVFDDASAGYAFQQWLSVPSGPNGYPRLSVKTLWRTGSYESYNSLYRYWVNTNYSYKDQEYTNDGATTYNGETRPAVGDLDGDGRAEIVLGLGPGGAGRMAVFDGAGAFNRWLTIPYSQYNQAQGGSWPAIGEVVP